MNHPFPPLGPGQLPPLPEFMDTSYVKTQWLDVHYADQSPNHRLDIYLPNEGKGPFPVIMVVHGGAFMFGDKRHDFNKPMLKGLDHGFSVVCIEYRLSGEAIFPSQIYDCKAAVRFLRANADKYQLDADHIGAWGPSAGGHLVAMLGTSADVRELEDLSMGNPDFSSAVQAVVDWCGPAEGFLTMDDELRESGFGIPNHSEELSPESRLLGRKITEVPDLVKFASPMTYITENVPPFLIQHGSNDPVVPVQQSIHLAEAIERTAGKQKVNLVVLPGAGHHGDLAFETEQNLGWVFDFLAQHLK
jgi:acetyl esterase/lipase